MKVVSTHVAVSALLRRRFPDFFAELLTVLKAAEIPVHELEGTRDIWARDYCPIQRHDGKFVSFTYRPDYLRNGYRRLITDWRQVRPVPESINLVNCGLVLDGGNIVLHDRSAIVTDKIFTENPQLSPRQVEDRLRSAFELEKLIIIPREPGDFFGHADGTLAWIGPGRVLMNDFTQVDPGFRRQLKGLLKKARVDLTEIPYAPETRRRSIPSARGCYVNLLALPQIVLVPMYGIPTDEEALAQIETEFSGRQVVAIDASGIAREGGSIHCVTSEWRQAAGTKKPDD